MFTQLHGAGIKRRVGRPTRISDGRSLLFNVGTFYTETPWKKKNIFVILKWNYRWCSRSCFHNNSNTQNFTRSVFLDPSQRGGLPQIHWPILLLFRIRDLVESIDPADYTGLFWWTLTSFSSPRSDLFRSFVDYCLLKIPQDRPSSGELLRVSGLFL